MLCYTPYSVENLPTVASQAMKQENPLVSILLPVYNNERFLPTCLASLCKQSYRNIEVVAIDDNSKDASFRMLKQARKKDRRIRFFRNVKRYGLAVTLNRLLKRAKGSYIAFMSPNDIASPQRLRRQLRFLLANDTIAAVGVQCAFIDKRNKRLGRSAFPNNHDTIAKTLLAALSMQPETIMVNRTLLPLDTLYFTQTSYPLIYTDVLMKCTKYAPIANLSSLLYSHRKTTFTTPKSLQVLPSLAKLWVKSVVAYNLRPSLRSLFFPLVS